jgi:dienelactone hydrolase
MNRKTIAAFLAALMLALLASQEGLAQEAQEKDLRATEIRHLDQTYDFKGYSTKEEWLARAAQLKKQIMVSAGLWPLPQKTPLKPVIFGKVDRGDHTVEKVYFESYPGHFVTGNLYRPKTITGRLPAVLCPHGHWTYGRLENHQHNSGPTRAANFARQGYVAFTWDMVGYVDSAAISHRFATGHRENLVDREALWSVNLLGLQLWNSIRSVDFLLTLPEVDPGRIACTGESGGGTQTFLLMAIDERIKAAAPVNMVSFLMQGGSLCENSPNLRIDTNNVEIASLMAPRPMMMVSATGDWTKNTMTSEYPAVRAIYRLFGAEDRITAVQMDAPHNYNQASREAVYGWFAHSLLGRAETGPIRERSGGVAPINDLLVYFAYQRPRNEMNEAQLIESLIDARVQSLIQARPADAASLDRYRQLFGDALRHSLMAEYPDPASVFSSTPQTTKLQGTTKQESVIFRRNKSERAPVTLFENSSTKPGAPYAVLAVPDAGPGISQDTSSLVEMLNKAGTNVLVVHSFPGGRKVPENIKFFTTYNRTDEAIRAQDVLTAIAYLNAARPGSRVSVAATGRAGLWTLLAASLAPAIDRIVVDATEFDSSSDEAFVKYLPIPGIRRAGDFTTAVAISPLAPLLIHNTGGKFRTDGIQMVYGAAGRTGNFKSQSSKLSNAEIAAWLTSK